MNRLFRRIRENENLDLAEESEDEEDFENMDANKYVNLNAVIPIECAFNQKHKKWIPVRLAGKKERLIHIDKLCANSYALTSPFGRHRSRICKNSPESTYHINRHQK
jgi:hypothetical protein